MTYTKPEVVALSHAVEAIQGTGIKIIAANRDGVVPLVYDFIPAYEADE